jgi:hypothetical protein
MKNIGHFEALDPGLTQRERGKIRELIFGTILKRCNDTLASLLTGSDLLTSGGLGFATANMAVSKKDDGQESKTRAAESSVFTVQENNKQELGRLIAGQFTHRLARHILNEWGVEVSEMDVTDIQVLDADVKKSLAAGVRANIEAATSRRNAEADAETERIRASGKADAQRIGAAGEGASIKIKAEAEGFRILEIAKAQEEAGKMLEQTPIAVTIRLAEAGAQALGSARSSLVVVPDVSTQTLMGLISSAAAVATQTQSAHPHVVHRPPQQTPQQTPTITNRPEVAAPQRHDSTA